MKLKITVTTRRATLTGLAKDDWRIRVFERDMKDPDSTFVEIPGSSHRVRPSDVVSYSIEEEK